MSKAHDRLHSQSHTIQGVIHGRKERVLPKLCFAVSFRQAREEEARNYSPPFISPSLPPSLHVIFFEKNNNKSKTL